MRGRRYRRVQIETIRRRAGEVQREIGNLVGVLRSLGEVGVESVRDELARLEEEKSALKAKQADLEQRREQLRGLGEMEERFLQSWHGLGDMLKMAEPGQQRRILRHVIETIEWTALEDNPKVGSYLTIS